MIERCCPCCGRPDLPVITGRRTITGPFETREQLREAVLLLLQDGMTGMEIAARFGLSISTVSRIKHGDRMHTINGYRVSVRRRRDQERAV